MKTMSPLGDAYIVGEVVPKPERVPECLVVIAVSANLAFPVMESLRSLFKHNPWITDILIYYEALGEQAMEEHEVRNLIWEVRPRHVESLVYTIPCDRVPANPRPFVGPKVCTYTAASRFVAQTYFFVDLDMWHFANSWPNVALARRGGMYVVQEAGTGMLGDEMFQPGGVYNGTPDDKTKFSAFAGYLPNADECAINTGYVIVGYLQLLEIEAEFYRPRFYSILPWMITPNGDKFIGNREQALFNLAALRVIKNRIHYLSAGWNVQVVKAPKLYPRPDANLALAATTDMVMVLHFNGYAAPKGPARKLHQDLQQFPETVALALPV